MANAVPLALGGYGPTLLAVVWAEFTICFVVLVARIITTWKITRRIKLDLYISVLTFTIALLSCIFLTLSIAYGLGQHIGALSTQQILLTIKWSWANQILAIFAIAFGKLAIVAFLQQIHGPEDKYKVIFLWTIALSNLVINTITVGMILGQCTPVQKLWDESLPGTCDGRLRNQNCAYFQGSWSAFVDFVLAVYPVVFFWKVQLKTTVKVGLCMLMGLGIAYGVRVYIVLDETDNIDSACVCAVLKTTKLAVLSVTSDVTYYISQLITWNETEMWIVLIVGCIPPIRPLFVKLFHKVTSTAKNYEQTSRSGTELRNFSSKRRIRETIDEDGSEQNILIETNINLTYEQMLREPK